ncbi:Herpes-BLLF1 domain containing protein, partial [Pyrenophora tritici-repentis]
MYPSTFNRVAFAAGIIASTASAAFNNAAKTNVAMYWGQGSNQISLAEVCVDPSIDIVNIGFVNQFPSKRGEYPGTNHANACGAQYYIDPTTGKESKLLSSCPGVDKAIMACQRRGKKVMLSLGGGWPTNYTLPTPDVANWFAEFLLGAYGPLTPEWKAANKPRPFGDAVIDGFDLDLEAAEWDVPTPDLLYKNYDVFGKYVKAHSGMLLSGAPQCVVPDARIFIALQQVPFDMLFTQFYNTEICSAAKAVKDMKANKPSTFTFKTWISWLKANSKNPNIKLYLGLAAGPEGLPTHKNHSLTPEEANYLIETYKGDSMFGGVMLWEATVSKENPTYGQSYGTWMKYAVEGTFRQMYHPVVSSSTIKPTSTAASTTKTSSSTLGTSTKVTSTTPASSSVATSTKMSSSTMATSTKVSSSVYATSSASSSSSSSVHASSSSAVDVSSSVASSSASVPSSSSVYVPVPTEISSSVNTVSSTFIEPSSIATISASETIISS